MFSKDFMSSVNRYVKLGEGEKIVGVFAGEPLEFMNNFKAKAQYPIGQSSYPEGTGRRFKINFLVPAQDKFIPLVFEGSSKTAIVIETVVSKFGKDYLYEITRTGSGTKTTYSVLPERSLKPEELEAVKGVTLVPLTIKSSDASDTYPS